jgi:hypothetical protein
MKFVSKILILSILCASIFSLTLGPKDQRKNLSTEDNKVADTQVPDQKAADTKAADVKPADTKAADTKAADTKAADTKAADTKAADTKEDLSVKKDLGNGFIRPAMVAEGTLPLKTNWDDKKRRYQN